MTLSKKNILLVLLAVIIIVFPLVMKSGSDFEGADNQAGDVISEISPGYEPWAEPLWEPPSGEVESLLFSLQVAIGAGIIGYVLGTFKEKKRIADNR